MIGDGRRRKRPGNAGCHAGKLGIVLLLLVLTGCWDRTEVNDLAIVLATGVDLSDDGKVELSAQIFLPRAAGGGPQGSTGGSGGNTTRSTVLRKAQGKTIAEAMNRLQGRLSRQLFWGHSEVIVFGREAASKGIREYLDFFLRYLQFREHAYVFLSKSRAAETLDLEPLLERSTSEELREMGNMKLGILVTLKKLAQMIDGDSESAVLTLVQPVVQKQEGNSPKETVSLRSLGILAKDRYVGDANGSSCYGLLILRNELETFVFSLPLPKANGEVSIQLKKIKTNVTPRIGQDGKWTLYADIRATGELLLNTTDYDTMAPSFMDAANREWRGEILKEVGAALDTVQKGMKQDAFGFAEFFRRRYPREWNENRKNWPSIYENLKVVVTVKTQIARVGKSALPQGVPKELIRKK